MSVQRSELYHFSAVDVFLELLKRRICYYTKKVQQSDGCDNMIGPINEKFSLRLIRSKLRKREESSGVHRSNVVHPEGVLQATVVGAGEVVQQDLCKSSSPLEDIFIAPISHRSSFAIPSESDNSTTTTAFASYSSDATQLPMFLYSTGNSRNSLNSSNDQDALVHPSGPAEDVENNNINNKEEASKKNIKGKLRKLVKRKTPPTENYALPLDIREQLKQIYVY